ncbi:MULTISPECIES: sulfotransferase [unclassified Rhodosalinus]|uniref:sulfotransferase n=1 Tax=unclassified Rhodosalinus TaxID=2630183 RepID=UPI003525AA97
MRQHDHLRYRGCREEVGEAPIFYCIGAAKAGTTWLHSYFAQHPECYMRSVKEIHFFDRKAGRRDAVARQLEVRVSEALRRQSRFSKPGGLRTKELSFLRDAIEWADLLDRADATSRDYLAYLWPRQAARSGAKRCGDITPQYATLDGNAFSRMAALGSDARFVFILRDPVARLWSHLRMRARIAQRREGRSVTAHQLAEDFLAGNLDLQHSMAAFCDYGGTLDRLFGQVARDRVHVAFFEELFTAPALGRLCTFLGLSAMPPPSVDPLNEGAAESIETKMHDRLRVWLEPQYRAVRERIPGGLPDDWVR